WCRLQRQLLPRFAQPRLWKPAGRTEQKAVYPDIREGSSLLSCLSSCVGGTQQSVVNRTADCVGGCLTNLRPAIKRRPGNPGQRVTSLWFCDSLCESRGYSPPKQLHARLQKQSGVQTPSCPHLPRWS